jgi:murein L,D-transpeptidase YcbB/YkuD
MKTFNPVSLLSFLCLLLLSAVSSASSTAEKEPPGSELCGRTEQIYGARRQSTHGDTVAAVTLVPEFYRRRDFTLAWNRNRNVEELLTAIDASRDEGLIPEDYHQAALESRLETYRSGIMGGCERAEFDILLSDALVRLGYHYLYGKVDPKRLDPHWNMQRRISGSDPVDLLQDAIDAESLGAFLRQLAPRSPLYDAMKKALARYREIEARGGWPWIPDGPSLKPGMRDERGPLIRERLAITGDLADPASPDPTRYDETLKGAVEGFQRRHMLEADGIVGKATLAAMNVPVTDHIDRIRVNMERARWVYRNLPDEYLVADIAGFEAELEKDHNAIWKSEIQVGRSYRQTPVFQDRIRYIVFNPTWTVPPTIFAEDILPKLRKDPGYLQEKNMGVIDSKGREIDAATIDWTKVTRRNFPYMLRQGPGPRNALGRIKFMFPNKHAVYLHDTPHKSGFKQTARAFSSGCIRVEKPFELAEILLNDPGNWSREEIDRVIESNETRSVPLKSEMPILLLYWTVGTRDGQFYFKPDVYSRDARVLAALDGEFRLDVPDNMPAWYKGDR